jgi:hypothetical protein
MKKVLSILIAFNAILFSVQCQVRLSEINDQNGGVADFIELYTPSANGFSLDGYQVLVRMGGSSTITSCFDLAGKTIGGSTADAKYFVIGGALASADYLVPTANSNFLEESSSGINLVFLVKNGTIIDLFAARTSKANAIASIQATPNYTLCGTSGKTLSFGNVQASDYNISTENAQLGALGKSYSFKPGTGTTDCGVWSKTNETPNATNVDGDPVFQFFSSAIEYPSDAVSSSWIDITTNGNNTLPSPSFAITGNSVSKTIQIRYVISETNIPSVSTTTPSFQIWTDKNPDGILDPTDAQLLNSEYTVSSMVTEGTAPNSKYIFNLTIPVTSNLKNLAGFLNTLYFKFTSGGLLSVPCFTSVTEMNFGEQALPVQLSNFVVKNDVNKNQLSWKTSSESNNKGFEIQRSMGNTNDFKTIGFVGTKAKQGNSESEISYSFEDANVKAGQTHYYRLNQIDFDGKSSLSSVKSIKPGSIESNLNVYPNPSQGSFTVNTGSNSGKLNIFVMDNTGRVVNQFMNVSTSNTRINNLKKGFYTLKIVNTESGEQSAQKIVVQ